MLSMSHTKREAIIDVRKMRDGVFQFSSDGKTATVMLKTVIVAVAAAACQQMT